MPQYSGRINTNEAINKTVLPTGMFQYITGFEILSLEQGNNLCFNTGSCEAGLVIFSGSCDLIVEGQTHKNLGNRENVFSGLPAAIYIPRDTEYKIISHGVQLGACFAKCNKKTKPAVISAADMKVIRVGKENWQREVRIIIGPDSPSVNMIIGETLNPSGNWSGIPPARHERNNLPNESLHEEMYYFKTDKPQGWGIERVYSKERDFNELIYLQDNIVTFMPCGYHQVVAAPGYILYYLFFLAGEGNILAQFDDPDHNWIKKE